MHSLYAFGKAGTVVVCGLLGDSGVAAGFDEAVGGEDLLLLLDEEFADGEGELVIEGLLIGLLGFVLAIFGGLEEAVIAAAELGFEVAPGAVECAGDGTGLLDVGHAGAVEFIFQLGTEVSALEALGEEEALEGDVLEVVADIGKAFLAVFEGLDEVEENGLHLLVSGGTVQNIG